MMEPTPIQEIPESLIEFNRARFKEEVSVGLFDLMQRHRINRTRLAEMLGVKKSRISHMFTGSQNFRLDTIADAFLSLGRAVHVTLGQDPDEYRIPNDEANYIAMDCVFGVVNTNIQGVEYGQGNSGATGGRGVTESPIWLAVGLADDVDRSLADEYQESGQASITFAVP